MRVVSLFEVSLSEIDGSVLDGVERPPSPETRIVVIGAPNGDSGAVCTPDAMSAARHYVRALEGFEPVTLAVQPEFHALVIDALLEAAAEGGLDLPEASLIVVEGETGGNTALRSALGSCRAAHLRGGAAVAFADNVIGVLKDGLARPAPRVGIDKDSLIHALGLAAFGGAGDGSYDPALSALLQEKAKAASRAAGSQETRDAASALARFGASMGRGEGGRAVVSEEAVESAKAAFLAASSKGLSAGTEGADLDSADKLPAALRRLDDLAQGRPAGAARVRLGSGEDLTPVVSAFASVGYLAELHERGEGAVLAAIAMDHGIDAGELAAAYEAGRDVLAGLRGTRDSLEAETPALNRLGASVRASSAAADVLAGGRSHPADLFHEAASLAGEMLGRLSVGSLESVDGDEASGASTQILGRRAAFLEMPGDAERILDVVGAAKALPQQDSGAISFDGSGRTKGRRAALSPVLPASLPLTDRQRAAFSKAVSALSAIGAAMGSRKGCRVPEDIHAAALKAVRAAGVRVSPPEVLDRLADFVSEVERAKDGAPRPDARMAAARILGDEGSGLMKIEPSLRDRLAPKKAAAETLAKVAAHNERAKDLRAAFHKAADAFLIPALDGYEKTGEALDDAFEADRLSRMPDYVGGSTKAGALDDEGGDESIGALDGLSTTGGDRSLRAESDPIAATMVPLSAVRALEDALAVLRDGSFSLPSVVPLAGAFGGSLRSISAEAALAATSQGVLEAAASSAEIRGALLDLRLSRHPRPDAVLRTAGVSVLARAGGLDEVEIRIDLLGASGRLEFPGHLSGAHAPGVFLPHAEAGKALSDLLLAMSDAGAVRVPVSFGTTDDLSSLEAVRALSDGLDKVLPSFAAAAMDGGAGLAFSPRPAEDAIRARFASACADALNAASTIQASLDADVSVRLHAVPSKDADGNASLQAVLDVRDVSRPSVGGRGVPLNLPGGTVSKIELASLSEVGPALALLAERIGAHRPGSTILFEASALPKGVASDDAAAQITLAAPEGGWILSDGARLLPAASGDAFVASAVAGRFSPSTERPRVDAFLVGTDDGGALDLDVLVGGPLSPNAAFLVRKAAMRGEWLPTAQAMLSANDVPKDVKDRLRALPQDGRGRAERLAEILPVLAGRDAAVFEALSSAQGKSVIAPTYEEAVVVSALAERLSEAVSRGEAAAGTGTDGEILADPLFSKVRSALRAGSAVLETGRRTKAWERKIAEEIAPLAEDPDVLTTLASHPDFERGAEAAAAMLREAVGVLTGGAHLGWSESPLSDRSNRSALPAVFLSSAEARSLAANGLLSKGASERAAQAALGARTGTFEDAPRDETEREDAAEISSLKEISERVRAEDASLRQNGLRTPEAISAALSAGELRLAAVVKDEGRREELSGWIGPAKDALSDHAAKMEAFQDAARAGGDSFFDRAASHPLLSGASSTGLTADLSRRIHAAAAAAESAVAAPSLEKAREALRKAAVVLTDDEIRLGATAESVRAALDSAFGRDARDLFASAGEEASSEAKTAADAQRVALALDALDPGLRKVKDADAIRASLAGLRASLGQSPLGLAAAGLIDTLEGPAAFEGLEGLAGAKGVAGFGPDGRPAQDGTHAAAADLARAAAVGAARVRAASAAKAAWAAEMEPVVRESHRAEADALRASLKGETPEEIRVLSALDAKSKRPDLLSAMAESSAFAPHLPRLVAEEASAALASAKEETRRSSPVLSAAAAARAAESALASVGGTLEDKAVLATSAASVAAESAPEKSPRIVDRLHALLSEGGIDALAAFLDDKKATASFALFGREADAKRLASARDGLLPLAAALAEPDLLLSQAPGVSMRRNDVEGFSAKERKALGADFAPLNGAARSRALHAAQSHLYTLKAIQKAQDAGEISAQDAASERACSRGASMLRVVGSVSVRALQESNDVLDAFYAEHGRPAMCDRLLSEGRSLSGAGRLEGMADFLAAYGSSVGNADGSRTAGNPGEAILRAFLADGASGAFDPGSRIDSALRVGLDRLGADAAEAASKISVRRLALERLCGLSAKDAALEIQASLDLLPPALSAGVLDGSVEAKAALALGRAALESDIDGTRAGVLARAAGLLSAHAGACAFGEATGLPLKAVGYSALESAFTAAESLRAETRLRRFGESTSLRTAQAEREALRPTVADPLASSPLTAEARRSVFNAAMAACAAAKDEEIRENAETNLAFCAEAESALQEAGLSPEAASSAAASFLAEVPVAAALRMKKEEFQAAFAKAAGYADGDAPKGVAQAAAGAQAGWIASAQAARSRAVSAAFASPEARSAAHAAIDAHRIAVARSRLSKLPEPASKTVLTDADCLRMAEAFLSAPATLTDRIDVLRRFLPTFPTGRRDADAVAAATHGFAADLACGDKAAAALAGSTALHLWDRSHAHAVSAAGESEAEILRRMAESASAEECEAAIRRLVPAEDDVGDAAGAEDFRPETKRAASETPWMAEDDSNAAADIPLDLSVSGKGLELLIRAAAEAGVLGGKTSSGLPAAKAWRKAPESAFETMAASIRAACGDGSADVEAEALRALAALRAGWMPVARFETNPADAEALSRAAPVRMTPAEFAVVRPVLEGRDSLAVLGKRRDEGLAAELELALGRIPSGRGAGTHRLAEDLSALWHKGGKIVPVESDAAVSSQNSVLEFAAIPDPSYRGEVVGAALCAPNAQELLIERTCAKTRTEPMAAASKGVLGGASEWARLAARGAESAAGSDARSVAEAVFAACEDRLRRSLAVSTARFFEVGTEGASPDAQARIDAAAEGAALRAALSGESAAPRRIGNAVLDSVALSPTKKIPKGHVAQERLVLHGIDTESGFVFASPAKASGDTREVLLQENVRILRDNGGFSGSLAKRLAEAGASAGGAAVAALDPSRIVWRGLSKDDRACLSFKGNVLARDPAGFERSVEALESAMASNDPKALQKALLLAASEAHGPHVGLDAQDRAATLAAAEGALSPADLAKASVGVRKAGVQVAGESSAHPFTKDFLARKGADMNSASPADLAKEGAARSENVSGQDFGDYEILNRQARHGEREDFNAPEIGRADSTEAFLNGAHASVEQDALSGTGPDALRRHGIQAPLAAAAAALSRASVESLDEGRTKEHKDVLPLPSAGSSFQDAGTKVGAKV